MKIAKTFTKKNNNINAIITGMLPQDKRYSFLRTTSDEINRILEGVCKTFLNYISWNRMMTGTRII